MAGLVMENIKSSAYADTLCWVSRSVIPLISGFSLTWHRKGSSDIANSKGDSGHPCLVPFDIGKESETTPLALTLADGFEYAADIQLNSFSPTPIFYVHFQ